MSLAAKSLVEDLLQVDDKKRLSAAEALAHPWLTQTKHSTELLQNDLTYLHSDRRCVSVADRQPFLCLQVCLCALFFAAQMGVCHPHLIYTLWFWANVG